MPKAPKIIARGDWWTIKAAAETPETAEILIYGDIGESWYGDSITAKAFVEQIAAVAASEITVRVNSFGGSVSDGIAIYNAIKRHPATVTVEIDGVAYSIASLIAMAGDRVRIAGNALMMIHAPWGMCAGNSEEMRQYADILDTYAEAMASSYMAKSGKSRDDVLSLLTDGKDHYYTAEQAIAEGFADEAYNAMPVAASLAKGFDLSRYSRPPAGRSSTSTEKPTMATPANAAGGPEKPETPAITAAERQQIEAKAREEALAADAARREEIETLFLLDARAHAGASEAMLALKAECLKNPNMTPDAVGKLILAKRAEGVQAINHPGHAPRVEAGQSEDEKWAAAVSNSIQARCGVAKPDPQNPVRGYRLIEIARAALERRGIQAGRLSALDLSAKALSPAVYASGGGMTTSDLPILLQDIMHKMVLSGFAAQPDTWSRFCKQGTVSDFRAWKRLSVGLFGNLDDVTEAGEYRYKTLPDATAESVTVGRKGNIIKITPEIIINDDTAYISSVTNMMGRGAKRTVEAKVYTVLNANAALSDSVALFHANHNNLAGTSAAPTVASLAAGRLAMGKQRDVGNVEYLDIRPAIWVGPDTYADEVRVLNESQYDTDSTGALKPNKSRGIVQDIVGTPRLSGTAWYLFADPSIAPVIEVVFLDGQSEPVLAMEEDFSTAGISYRVEYPHGVGVIDFRGAYKNAGA